MFYFIGEKINYYLWGKENLKKLK
uniref:Uncharacterized protein n=1 Tax=Triatoma infestans TaxID=30076 RepID=A0A161M115_TRIIF